MAQMARDIVESAAGKGEFVFSTNGGSAPVAVGSKIKTRLDRAMKSPPWRLHDLRRTCATGMAALGVAPHIVEAVLNHISGAKASVAENYNRAAYGPEKKSALELWSRYVALVVDPDLYAAHEKFIALGDDKARDFARTAFTAAVAEGSERWDLYLKTITTGGGANVVAMPSRKRSK